MTKKDKDNPDYIGIVLCSKGLGSNYAKENQLKYNIVTGKQQLLHIRHITDKIYHYQDTTKQPYTQTIKGNYYGYMPKIKV